MDNAPASQEVSRGFIPRPISYYCATFLRMSFPLTPVPRLLENGSPEKCCSSNRLKNSHQWQVYKLVLSNDKQSKEEEDIWSM